MLQAHLENSDNSAGIANFISLLSNVADTTGILSGYCVVYHTSQLLSKATASKFSVFLPCQGSRIQLSEDMSEGMLLFDDLPNIVPCCLRLDSLLRLFIFMMFSLPELSVSFYWGS